MSQGEALISTETYFGWGYTKSELGQYESAIADYNMAIQLSPDYAIAYYNRGNAKINLGRTSEVVQHFQTALELAEQVGNEGLKAIISRPVEIHIG